MKIYFTNGQCPWGMWKWVWEQKSLKALFEGDITCFRVGQTTVIPLYHTSVWYKVSHSTSVWIVWYYQNNHNCVLCSTALFQPLWPFLDPNWPMMYCKKKLVVGQVWLNLKKPPPPPHNVETETSEIFVYCVGGSYVGANLPNTITIVSLSALSSLSSMMSVSCAM